MRAPEAREEPSDAALVQAARAGDRGALAELLRRHRAMLLSLCRRALGDDDLAEDAAQEAALGALVGLDGLRQPESFGAWLAGIGLNVCRRWLRQRHPAMWSWEAVAGGVQWKLTLEVGPDPAEEALASDLARRVRRAVSELPPGQRQAVALMYFAGMTHAEVAAELGIPVSAVKTRLHKGRAALRPRLSTLWRYEMPNDTETLVPMEPREVVRVKGEQGAPGYVVVLAEVGGERVLPIWIGETEAVWLALAIEGAEFPRPGTYALMSEVVQAMGGRLVEVRISRLLEEVFYAELVCENGRGARRTIDARPSDALNLAARLHTPVLVSSQVLAAGGATRPAERARRLLDERRAEMVDAGTAELVAEARERWTSSAARVRAAQARLDADEGTPG